MMRTLLIYIYCLFNRDNTCLERHVLIYKYTEELQCVFCMITRNWNDICGPYISSWILCGSLYPSSILCISNEWLILENNNICSTANNRHIVTYMKSEQASSNCSHKGGSRCFTWKSNRQFTFKFLLSLLWVDLKEQGPSFNAFLLSPYASSSPSLLHHLLSTPCVYHKGFHPHL